MAENETKMKMDFSAENESESHLIILVFFFPFHAFSHQVSPTMRRQYLVQFRLLCRWSLMGFHFPHVQCIESLWHFCRWHFNPWTVCFPGLLLSSESNFPQCTVLYWHLNKAPIVKYPLNWGWCAWSAEGSLKQWLPNDKLLLLSHKLPWCDLLTAVKNYNKSLEKLQDFFFKTETKTKTKYSRPRPRLSFLSSRRLETKTLVSRLYH